MSLTVVAVGEKMPTWVTEVFHEYAKRLPHEYRLQLIEIPAAKRHKNANSLHLKTLESDKILAALPKGAYVVALDEHGALHTSTALAQRLGHWRREHPQICFVIGGPDGLSEAILTRAHEKWSLSPLTLPHPMVRVVLAEQLYRAWSILQDHPYHRE
ncbi:MAG: 23S rRNA (pseudouridine(1915)-N(3))-methyltransferase RlmH [Gammaproteobacteria bacterium]